MYHNLVYTSSALKPARRDIGEGVPIDPASRASKSHAGPSQEHADCPGPVETNCIVRTVMR